MNWAILLFSLFLLVRNTVSLSLREILVESRVPDAEGIVVGLDAPQPRISWSFPESSFVQQLAYQIIVERFWTGDIVWDSSVITSPKTLHIKYDGIPLLSDTRYRVRITAWGDDGLIYNGRVLFHMALLNPEAEFTGSWIGHTQIYMNQLRKEFMIPSAITEATAFISGLGYYELYLNNQNVDPTRKLDPGWTTYEVRALYSTFNVTSFLSVGNNCIGVLLGNGWYSQIMNIPPAAIRPSYGPPKVIFQLNIKLANGNTISVVSDTTWMGRQGFILFDSVYGGETIDGRLIQPNWGMPGFNDLSYWINAQILPPPGGNLTAQMMDPIRTRAAVTPIKIWGGAMNQNIVDFGQNMAGWIRYKLSGPRGATVQFRYAEILENPSSGIYSNTIYIDNLRAAAQTDVYILNGTKGGEIFEPRFTVHGFRYVEVRCTLSTLTGTIQAIPVNSLATPAGTFHTDNVILNQIQHNILWGQQSNLMSLPTDCPQRDERKGWMGDAALTVDEALFNFKLSAFYQNWAQNIHDTQTPDGAVGDTTPLTFGGRPADPAWGTAYPTTVMALYDHTGDLETATLHYSGLVAWVEMLGRAVSQSGYAKMYYHYGDWVPPPPYPYTNASLTSVASYALDVLTVSKLAGLLGKTADQQKYSSLYAEIGQQFHKAFYNSTINSYVGKTLTGNVLALAIEAVPASLKPTILNTIIQIISGAANHSTCGIIGAKWLYPILSENGYHNLALQIATKTTYPSLGYMFTNHFENATTLWEVLDAPNEDPSMNSRNHIMFGSIGAWFYRYVGGIKPNGLEQIEISPAPVGPNSPVKRATVSYTSLKGPISVKWEKKSTSFGMDVTIPATTTARVIIPHHESPYSSLKVDGEIIADFTSGSEPLYFSSPRVQSIGLKDDGSIELNMRPGKYSFFASI